MKLTRADNDAPALVAAYGDGGFRINEERLEGSVMIVNGEVSPWPASSIDHIDEGSFDEIARAEPGVELLLIGVGADLCLLPAGVRDALEAKDLPFDVMDTGAAARTFNVLALEGRRVAAALIAVE